MNTLQSDKLLQVLALTTRQVKIMCGDKVIDRVSSAEAIRLAKLREYEGIGTDRRVRIMRLTAVAMMRNLPWEPCYRTQGAPAIGPWAGGSPNWFDNYRT